MASKEIPLSAKRSEFDTAPRFSVSGIITLVILMLILMGMITVAGVWSMRSIHNSSEQIVRDRMGKTELVVTMHVAALKRAEELQRLAMLYDPPIEEDTLLVYSAFDSRYSDAHKALLKQSLSTNELQILSQLTSLNDHLLTLHRKTVELIQNRQTETARSLLLRLATPVQSQLLEALIKLRDHEKQLAQKEQIQIHEDYLETRTLMITLSITALMLALIISLFVIGRTKRHYREREEYIFRIREADQAKSDFLTNMSHEIRTPLTAINGYAESLIENPLGDRERLQHLGTILRNGKYLQKIINEILDLSKIEANRLNVEIQDTSPFEVLNEVESIFGLLINEKGLDFNIQFMYPIPTTIQSDPIRLKQILLNIVGNALKYTEYGGITVTCKYDKQGQTLILAVTDTGVGMSAEQANNIFELFAEDSSTARKAGGSGLGLCISKKIAQQLGGDIKCTSHQGKGTQFTITVSTGPVAQNNLVFTLPEKQFDRKPMAHRFATRVKGNVLLAEDSVDIQNLVAMYLKRVGAKVKTVNNGQEAIEAALDDNFDLILMDMQMPVMDGLQATKWLRSSNHKLPIIALTANVMKEDREQMLAAGVSDIIAKPIELEQFYTVLNQYLEKDIVDVMPTVNQNIRWQLASLMQKFSSAIENQNIELLKNIAQELKEIQMPAASLTLADLVNNIEKIANDGEFDTAAVVEQDFNELRQRISSNSGK